MPTNGKRPNYTADAALVERIAYFTFANGAWSSARDVRRALKELYPDLDIGIQGVLSCQRAAVDTGVVTVSLHLDHERAEAFRLEPMMRQRFGRCGIRQVSLVPGDPHMLDELEREISVRSTPRSRRRSHVGQPPTSMISCGRRPRGAGRVPSASASRGAACSTRWPRSSWPHPADPAAEHQGLPDRRHYRR